MFQALKLGSYFAFPCIWNILKEQLFTASGSYFQELLFGPDKLPGLSRNGPQNSPANCACCKLTSKFQRNLLNLVISQIYTFVSYKAIRLFLEAKALLSV